MRKCRSASCRVEIPRKKDCSDPVKAGGFCGMDCLMEHTRAKAEKANQRKARRELIEAKERIKTKGEHAKEAQSVFNAWVRARDEHRACISCGRHHKGQYHAGHYISVGAAPEIRFNVFNVNKQCSVCNVHLSSNAVKYRIGLIDKYGQMVVDRLEGKNPPKRYGIDDLKRIKRIFRKRLKHQRWLNERKNHC